MYRTRLVTALPIAICFTAWPALAQDVPAGGSRQVVGRTPPRLSFADGEVSFWRPGAQDWTSAQVNTPLAPGDVLYAGDRSNLELQVGGHAFVRAGEKTQVGLENQEPDFLQFQVTGGHASLDARRIEPGHTIEVDTPNATFTVERPGYYRLDVTEDTTTFICRRGGSAVMVPAGGSAMSINPSDEVVVQGTTQPQVATYVAPELDDWDRWNYDRTDHLIDAMSSRYVPSDVYGVDALDHYGNWRVVPTYGPVWVPDGVASGWVPYSTGSWIWDPYFGWTWVDTAPWGWAPYHYGRWVSVNGFWGWAPGPLVVQPFYAPALVAFFGGPHFGVSVGFSVGAVGWVALGWGEPFVPWWGPAGFVGVPCWRGWGGPHIVNNVVINRTTIVNVNNIRVFQNANVSNAVVVVGRDRFGHGVVTGARFTQNVRDAVPLHGRIPVRPTNASLDPTNRAAARPPQALWSRSVVATRAPSNTAARLRTEGLRAAPAPAAGRARLVSAPRSARPGTRLPQPPYGQSATERSRPPLPPRFEPRTGTQRAPAPAAGAARGPAAAEPGMQAAPGRQRAEQPPPPPHEGGAPGGARPEGRGAQAPRGEAPAGGAAERAPAPPPVPGAHAPAAREARPAARPPEAHAPSGAPPREARPAAPAPPRRAPESRGAPAPPAARNLPGEPANRLYSGRVQVPRQPQPARPAGRMPGGAVRAPAGAGRRPSAPRVPAGGRGGQERGSTRNQR